MATINSDEPIETLAEIDVRGRFLMMACDIEFSLLLIMIYSTPNPLKQIRKFKKYTMGTKIEAAIKDLKKYKRKYYKQYKTDLDKLEEFREIRNALAHNKLDFVDSSLKEIKATYIDVFEDENGKEQEAFKFTIYPISFLNSKVVEYRKLNLKLIDLAWAIKGDYEGSLTPLIHPSAGIS